MALASEDSKWELDSQYESAAKLSVKLFLLIDKDTGSQDVSVDGHIAYQGLSQGSSQCFLLFFF